VELAQVRGGLVASGLRDDLVDEVLASYVEAKRRYYLGDHRPQEVEGGRFSEGVFRLLQQASNHDITPLGKTLPSVDRLLVQLENATGQPDSVRLHIPRTLKLIYDIRNKRDAAHLGDNIDPNLQDATLVTGNMDWVMAELIRLFHRVPADDAHRIIEELVTKDVPAIEEIDGQPVILSDLPPRDQALLLLYKAGAVGADLDELAAWLRVSRKDHLRTRLLRLDEDRLVLRHPASGRFHITRSGTHDVERRRLAHPV
jgi:hypothetical protein